MIDDHDPREVIEKITKELQNGEDADFKKAVDLAELLYKAEEFDYLADFIEDELPINTSDSFFSEVINRASSNKPFAEEMVGLVQENPFIAPKDLETIHTWSELIWDDKRCGTGTAAINPRTPINVLKTLARNKDADFRYRVAINKASTDEVLCAIIDYEFERAHEFKANDLQSVEQRSLLIQIAIRTDISDSTLSKLAELIDDEVIRTFIINNPNSSKETMELCKSRGYSVDIDLDKLKKPFFY